MRPTIVRAVHYQAYGTPGGEFQSVPRAATVTDVRPLLGIHDRDPEDEHGYEVRLCIMNPTGLFFSDWLKYDADGKPGTWRWPPREPYVSAPPAPPVVT